MKRLYIIAGPNGAGKTTASYTILPEIFECEEFVNADEIARGISPFRPEEVSIQAGKIMLERIRELFNKGSSFAFETTLASKIFLNYIQKARSSGYEVNLLFLWLNSPELAISRVKARVKEGGHDIPENVIKRRYEKGLFNLFRFYIPMVDQWFFVDNSNRPSSFIAEGSKGNVLIRDENFWLKLKSKYHG